MHEMKARMAVLGSVLILFFLAGCATMDGSASGGNNTTALELRQIDGSVFGRESFNVIRVETHGPNSQQLYGYFLYRDGLTVQVNGPMTGKTLGKIALKEVQADYQRIIKENMINGGNLVIQEALHGKAVCGYTANMPMLNYTVWGTTDALGGTSILQLTLP
jgi:hypothetical protein